MAKNKPEHHCINLTVDEVGRLVGELAEQEIFADQLTAKLNKELDAVRARHEEKLQNLRGNINIRREALEQWADAHKELFKDPRSLEFERGTIGFRLGQWQAKTVKTTWAKVLIALERHGLREWIRTKVEIDKETMIADRELPEAKNVLGIVGVKVVQDDAFFCEIKKDEAPDKIVTTDERR